MTDRDGRRPVLLIGLAIFTLGGVVCTSTTNVWVLLVGRFVQGVGACAGTIVARALVGRFARSHASRGVASLRHGG